MSFLAGASFLVGCSPLITARRDYLEPILKKVEEPEPENLVDIAIIFDDVGASIYDKDNLEKLRQIDFPGTYAVLPDALNLEENIKILAHYPNAEVFLHQPMEPYRMDERGIQNWIENAPYTEGLYLNTPLDKMDDIVDKNLYKIFHLLQKYNAGHKLIGLNNHMGSAFTASPKRMAKIAESLRYKQPNLIFVDSNTYVSGYDGMKAIDVMNDFNVNSAINNLFLDNIESYEYTIEQLQKLGDIALRDNTPKIAIGHIGKDTTVNALIDYLGDYDKVGKHYVRNYGDNALRFSHITDFI